jgi:hypothetical protein
VWCGDHNLAIDWSVIHQGDTTFREGEIDLELAHFPGITFVLTAGCEVEEATQATRGKEMSKVEEEEHWRRKTTLKESLFKGINKTSQINVQEQRIKGLIRGVDQGIGSRHRWFKAMTKQSAAIEEH